MHHQRRRSGHASANTSMTDVRKAVTLNELSAKYNSKAARPAPMTRRTTDKSAQKLGKSPREREREWDDERWWEDERESFPQFCMTCEKQFAAQDERVLYCSEECRAYDQDSTTPASVYPSSHSSNLTAHYPYYAAGHPEPRDIIPRASPSRPSPSNYSPPTTPNTATHTSAISALRSLTIRPPSPPSPSSSYHPSIWPFSRSAATSPSNSYTRPASGMFSSTYDGGYYANGYGTSAGYDMERPLPSRRPGTYSRPKSIELVTPMIAGR
ncbi:hypothetical protein CONLIGDRAFT_185240 [Coniochaeta ligniaria NRRL 30616]|uniref:Life-span regulatory factor domain-containing protein n=1 Tax=Coniochaeta ligniaria NRRL 30616 TaxID=1408157 RepID=A0A1J7J1H9_9PEZI|nr:hypothetical protein CONLIGDRAFT_185240 [Coniochaeta ligniaria NRRL 30616]